jgi:hypothetical protein
MRLPPFNGTLNTERFYARASREKAPQPALHEALTEHAAGNARYLLPMYKIRKSNDDLRGAIEHE